MHKAKIQDVARLADVSLSTVSAVLNGRDIVREETKQRILKAIEQLRYRPDLYASNLARRQTRMLGLIVSDLVNPFFAELAQGIEQEAGHRGYQISLSATGFSPSQLRTTVQQMLGMRVAGLAVMTSELDREAFLELESSGTPAVFLDVGTVGPTTSNIRVNTRGGMMTAVQHLAELGHRDILLVCHSQNDKDAPALRSHKYRREGFISAVREFRSLELKTYIIDEPGSGADAGLKAIEIALKKIHFTAVIAITDMVAMGVYRALQKHGHRIPQDVSIVGFDNTYVCQFLTPPLTTIDIPRAELSNVVLETLLDTIEHNHTGREIRLKTRLQVRESTAPPRTPPKHLVSEV